MTYFGGSSRRKGFAVTDFLVILAIIGVLVAVAVPNVLGYVNYEINDIDNSNAVKIENVVLRLVADGRLKLGNELRQASLENEVKSRMGGKIPDCQRIGDNFYVNRASGDVAVKRMQGANDIKLSSQTLAEGLFK